MTILNRDIYNKCINHYNEISGISFVVRNAIPIPFFGDVERYLKSPRRILTAALNPSGREFPQSKPARFDVREGRAKPEALERTLSDYFERHPYRAWFGAFEHVLNGLDATYGGKMSNGEFSCTALHIDICSPVATDPTWSRLLPEQRAVLTPFGSEIFFQIIKELRPSLIIASMGWSHLFAFHPALIGGRAWPRIAEYTTTGGGGLLKSPLWLQVGLVSFDETKVLFANASAANTPFGRFTNGRKWETGEKLHRYLQLIEVQESLSCS